MGGDDDGGDVEGSVLRQHGGLADEWLPKVDDKIYGGLTCSGIEPSTLSAVGGDKKTRQRNKKAKQKQKKQVKQLQFSEVLLDILLACQTDGVDLYQENRFNVRSYMCDICSHFKEKTPLETMI